MPTKRYFRSRKFHGIKQNMYTLTRREKTSFLFNNFYKIKVIKKHFRKDEKTRYRLWLEMLHARGMRWGWEIKQQPDHEGWPDFGPAPFAQEASLSLCLVLPFIFWYMDVICQHTISELTLITSCNFYMLACVFFLFPWEYICSTRAEHKPLLFSVLFIAFRI